MLLPFEYVCEINWILIPEILERLFLYKADDIACEDSVMQEIGINVPTPNYAIIFISN